MPQKELPPQEVMKKFDTAVDRVKRGLRASAFMMPPDTTDLSTLLQKHTHLVDNNEFRKKSLGSALQSDTPAAQEMNQNQLDSPSVRARFLPSYLTGDSREILVRYPFVAHPSHSSDLISHAILEELSHGFYDRERELSLYSLPNSANALTPGVTHEERIAILRQWKQRFYGSTDIDPNLVMLRTNGFFSQFWDYGVLPNEAVPYPAFVHPYVFEELRASIVSSLLMGSLIGSEVSPAMPPENQWLTGMGIMLKDKKNIEDYPIQVYGSMFVSQAVRQQEIGTSLRELLKAVHTGPIIDGMESYLSKYPHLVPVFNMLAQKMGKLLVG
ncbi:MAG: hypothetical protein NUV52_02850 [Candidatus Roizmanbacteria bacterium]|nr:hypothetical protein [Candidatus Roizmanbacteria bacterium]